MKRTIALALLALTLALPVHGGKEGPKGPEGPQGNGEMHTPCVKPEICP